MNKVFLISIICLAFSGQIYAQCYEANIKEADMAYSHDNYSKAYQYYKNALKCPDASRFENGKSAKRGMEKCLPSVKIEGFHWNNGVKDYRIDKLLSWKGGRKTFHLSASKIDSWSISLNCISVSQWIRLVDVNYQNNTFTIEWDTCYLEHGRCGYLTLIYEGWRGKDTVYYTLIQEESTEDIRDESYAETNYLKFVGVSFSGSDKSSHLMNLVYEPRRTGHWRDTTYIKIYDIEGRLMQDSYSPEGYSQAIIEMVDNRAFWSNGTAATYFGGKRIMKEDGIYRFEIWKKEKILEGRVEFHGKEGRLLN